jgi:hypothetical protein
VAFHSDTSNSCGWLASRVLSIEPRPTASRKRARSSSLKGERNIRAILVQCGIGLQTLARSSVRSARCSACRPVPRAVFAAA